MAAKTAEGAAGKGTGDGQQQQQQQQGGDGKTGEQQQQAAGEGAGAGDGKTGDGKTGDGKAADDGKGGKGDEGKGEGDGKGKAADGTQGAPDTYELTLPEDGILDERDRTAIEKYAKAQNLSNDDAQALLEEHAQQLRTQSEAWLEETTKDKHYGGDKLAETQRLARLAIEKVRPEGHPRRDAFKQLLNKGGVFNHLEVVSFLADLGRMMGEDTGTGAAGSSGKGSGKKSLAEKLYTHPTSKVEEPAD